MLSFRNTVGDSNTAVGYGALGNNTTGGTNTAVGFEALAGPLDFPGSAGFDNTASGFQALHSNSGGSANAVSGYQALYSNTIGSSNTANGSFALYSNTTGNTNTASGQNALYSNTISSANAAYGFNALYSNTTGGSNTAMGQNALLFSSTGNNNIGIGANAGFNLTTGSNNIDIGNLGVAGESGIIRIGTQGTHLGTFIAGIYGVPLRSSVPVFINANGRLGTIPSAARFKERIKPMDSASEAILALKPVTFRYKQDIDPDGIPQFGLVAEEVEKVNSDLVARDEQGKPYTVRYEAVNAMLLNEFLKEHKTVGELEATVANLVNTVKEQAAQIEKVSAQVDANKPPPQFVLNNQ
jgi:hypothetical protein